MIKKTIWILLISILLTITGCGFGNNQAQDMRDTRGVDLSRHFEGPGQQQRTIPESPRPFGQISSESTDTASNQYPHTKAIQIQHAKYAFITVDKEGKEQSIQLPEEVTRNLPEGVQNLTPDQITRLLPEDISQVLPRGTEHLTPDAIARLIKQGAGQGQPGMTPDQGAQPEQRAEAPAPTAPTPTPERAEATPAPTQPAQEAPQQAEQPAKQAETPAPAPKAEGLSALESQVIELTNQERQKNGLSPLQADTALSNVARQKSNDMQTNNYFSHTSPTYGSPFDMMRDFGISYNAAAENIAQGQRSAQEVVQAWMNSEGHRKNILDGKFTHIGVGHTANGNYWTQMFISK